MLGERRGVVKAAPVVESDIGMPGLRAERDLAIELARAAGTLLRDALVGPRSITYKGSPTNLVILGHGGPVTDEETDPPLLVRTDPPQF